MHSLANLSIWCSIMCIRVFYLRRRREKGNIEWPFLINYKVFYFFVFFFSISEIDRMPSIKLKHQKILILLHLYIYISLRLSLVFFLWSGSQLVPFSLFYIIMHQCMFISTFAGVHGWNVVWRNAKEFFLFGKLETFISVRMCHLKWRLTSFERATNSLLPFWILKRP